MGRLSFRMFALFCAVVLTSVPAFAADEFYQEQLRAGKADFQANRIPQATDELRIAAFGLLEQPVLLAETLARLAVAQHALGQNTEAARTIDRFIDVERKFSPYATVELEAAVKTKFEELVMKQVPRQMLASLPGLSRLTNYEFQRIASLPPAKRAAAYEAGAQAEPKNVEWPLALTRDAASRGVHSDVIKWGTKVLELDAANADVKRLIARARVSRRECKEALALITATDLQQQPDLYAEQTVCFAETARWKEAETALANVPQKLKTREDVRRASQQIAKANDAAKRAEAARLAAARPSPAPASTSGAARPSAPQTSSSSAAPKAPEAIDNARRLIREGKYTEAVQRLRPVVVTEPENRTLRLSLLEAAVLARDWRTAATQVPIVTPLTPGEELYMFYASVALYETGRHDEAKLFMEKARPRMVPSPMVDYYVKAVLGQQRGG